MKKLGLVALLVFSQLSFAQNCSIYFDSNEEMKAVEMSSEKLAELGYYEVDSANAEFIVTTTTTTSHSRTDIFGNYTEHGFRKDITMTHPVSGFNFTEEYIAGKAKNANIQAELTSAAFALNTATSIRAYEQAKVVYQEIESKGDPAKSALDVFILEKLPSCSTLYGN